MDPAGAEEKADPRQMTVDALANVDAGRVIDHREVEAWVENLVNRVETVTRQPD